VPAHLSPAAEPALPSDPNVRAIFDSVLAQLKYSFLVVAAETQPLARRRFDETVRKFLATRETASRKRWLYFPSMSRAAWPAH